MTQDKSVTSSIMAAMEVDPETMCNGELTVDPGMWVVIVKYPDEPPTIMDDLYQTEGDARRARAIQASWQAKLKTEVWLSVGKIVEVLA